MSANYMSPLSFPEEVLRRPRMYTSGGTFEEVIAFLAGFISGLAEGDFSLPSVRRWAEFQIWMMKQMGHPLTTDPFREFKTRLDVDQDACAELLQWLSHFQTEVAEQET